MKDVESAEARLILGIANEIETYAKRTGDIEVSRHAMAIADSLTRIWMVFRNRVEEKVSDVEPPNNNLTDEDAEAEEPLTRADIEFAEDNRELILELAEADDAAASEPEPVRDTIAPPSGPGISDAHRTEPMVPFARTAQQILETCDEAETFGTIAKTLGAEADHEKKALKHAINVLVEEGRLVVTGERRGTRYRRAPYPTLVGDMVNALLEAVTQ